jgi:putative effector of murein hydrolase
MPKFVELWVYLSASPLFGLTATLVVYVLAYSLYQRLHQAPWANPVLWSVLVIASGLLATDVDYPTYFAGAQFIHFLLGPAVFAVLTGIVGALLGKYLFDALGIPTDAAGWAARGFALGTVSHGIGAARAIAVNADAGAYAGLALALQVLLASLLIPLAVKLLALLG